MNGLYSNKSSHAYDMSDSKNDLLIHKLFESIAGQYPETTAIIFKNQSISYRELNKKANELAHLLVQHKVDNDETVGIKLDRSIDMIISILAVMKAGGAFLPIDPTYPENRIKFMLEDSETRLLITTPSGAKQPYNLKEINLSEITNQIDTNPNTKVNSSNLAYMIYTSGTTGTPKGVMVEHAGFVNMCLSQIALYGLCPSERVLQFASISFDASVYEIFLTLLSGATLVLISKEEILNRQLFLDYVDLQKITFLVLPPIFLNSLERAPLKPVKTLVTAGEACNIPDALFYSKTKNYYNAYGPTEASVCVSNFRVNASGKYENYMPVGKPIPNISFQILDSEMNPVHKGETGELCISGIGLARGYKNKEELTNKFFISNPSNNYERLYRTGDIAKELPDGNIIILGRIDQQVKISGHRIELGAIEFSMKNLQFIKNALVSVQEHKHEKYLCAYYTAAENINAESIREQLLNELPSFMIPHWFIQVREFTMTKNGKIDKSALPSPFDLNQLIPEGETSPYTGDLARFIELCKEVLDLKSISPSDNFFLIGGHSLKAVNLCVKIHKHFKVSLTIADIYEWPKIADIFKTIQKSKKTKYPKFRSAPFKKYYASSSAQKRMYIMNSVEPADLSYNVSIILRFNRVFSLDTVQMALNLLIERHEILRTRFSIHYDEIVQEILPKAEISIQDETISELELREVAKNFVKPFDLKSTPILRAGYFTLSEGGLALIIDTHHIVADGTSMGILVNELTQSMSGIQLDPTIFQYKDFAEWEKSTHSKKDYFKEDEEYWWSKFKIVPKWEMPTDFPRLANLNNAGEKLIFKTDPSLSEDIKKYLTQHNVSLFQFMLTGYFILLNKYSGQHDLIVGTGVANRPLEEVENMVGMFVNLLPLKAEILPDMSFNSLVTNISSMAIESFEHQDYPFETLISKLGLSGKSQNKALINTTFMVQNINFFDDQNMDGIVSKYENVTGTSKFDFSFFIIDKKEYLEIEVEFNTNLYKSETISNLVESYLEITHKGLNNPNILIKNISIIKDEVQSKLQNFLDEETGIDDLEFDL